MNEQQVNSQSKNAQPVTQPVNAQPVTQPANTQPVAQPVTPQPAAQPVNAQHIAQPVNAQPVAQPVARPFNAQPVARPVAQPKIQYMMTFPDAMNSCFKKYLNFNGRASRAEFWWFFLLNIIAATFLILNSTMLQMGNFGILFLHQWSFEISIALAIPLYMAGTRRLHDIGRTGWWQLLYLSGFGSILIAIWACFKSQPTPNKYGDVPCKLQ